MELNKWSNFTFLTPPATPGLSGSPLNSQGMSPTSLGSPLTSSGIPLGNVLLQKRSPWKCCLPLLTTSDTILHLLRVAVFCAFQSCQICRCWEVLHFQKLLLAMRSHDVLREDSWRMPLVRASVKLRPLVSRVPYKVPWHLFCNLSF